jgi:hypothetical protein
MDEIIIYLLMLKASLRQFSKILRTHNDQVHLNSFLISAMDSEDEGKVKGKKERSIYPTVVFLHGMLG